MPSLFLTAIGGAEMALWDLAGKAMGVPLYRPLGGRVRDKMRDLHAVDAAEAVARALAFIGTVQASGHTTSSHVGPGCSFCARAA